MRRLSIPRTNRGSVRSTSGRIFFRQSTQPSWTALLADRGTSCSDSFVLPSFPSGSGLHGARPGSVLTRRRPRVDSSGRLGSTQLDSRSTGAQRARQPRSAAVKLPIDHLPYACGGAAGVIKIDGAERVASPWWTASMLLPSGSKTKAA